ncbi:hypothetical protein HC028_25790 [Planosporangium flavigriseum]|uniref:Uncharacterized protein n=1 Tax=Planosporangium flavigriseum TaxID=373681 RepID=A0A8J3LQ23_9ACTN|nr:hypothetical protein [Planosporangium flavigriseum]NJC67891.1 hypothetical protein [Planosporangium flavigriseum]GIG76737.1 hypothetical protein Pfl04_51410 [Planosporangium flavigriseum]
MPPHAPPDVTGGEVVAQPGESDQHLLVSGDLRMACNVDELQTSYADGPLAVEVTVA